MTAAFRRLEREFERTVLHAHPNGHALGRTWTLNSLSAAVKGDVAEAIVEGQLSHYFEERWTVRAAGCCSGLLGWSEGCWLDPRAPSRWAGHGGAGCARP